MSKILAGTFAVLFALSINTAQAAGGAGGGAGGAAGGAGGGVGGAAGGAGSYGAGGAGGYGAGGVANPSGTYTPSGTQGQYNQNPSYYDQSPTNGSSYYNQNQGNNPTYYRQSDNAGYGGTPSSQSNPQYNNNGSQYNTTVPKTNANPYNTNTNSPNQPQAYNIKGNRNQVAVNDDDDDKDNSNHASNATATNSKYPLDRAGTVVDRQINDKIRDKITGWFKDNYKNINLNTYNGVVTINGFVGSKEDLNTLLNDIRGIDGVRSVNNNVEVRKES